MVFSVSPLDSASNVPAFHCLSRCSSSPPRLIRIHAMIITEIRPPTRAETAEMIKSLLTLPMPKGGGFLVRRPLRRLRGIGVLHDLPKREFPCAPRYVLFPFMQLWICLPRLCAGCSLQHSHLCRDGFRTLGNPIRGRSIPLSVDSDSHKQSTSDSMGRTYRP